MPDGFAETTPLIEKPYREAQVEAALRGAAGLTPVHDLLRATLVAKAQRRRLHARKSAAR
ncbi:MAG: hypothetical protein WDN44_16260 [Sphingomonas sp.]